MTQSKNAEGKSRDFQSCLTVPPHTAILTVVALVYQTMGGDMENWNDEEPELKAEYREIALKMINEAYLDVTGQRA